ncbi:helix-turn-helix domain-containing protein [Clavibacter capsici]|uniref:helix-turn-helix domain-containing protein n=1 Tax=Clavibacter capsici TaxID=1874630 RepID=UPI00142838D9|nr:helix-turn-helix transcriptional regulator [Clavibacter capsici]QIS39076.1 helix-turn-helix transcriptional regulator [Clavibacter capsici]
MEHDVHEAGTVDEVVGRNLARIREARGVTQGEFSTRMRAYLGQGWQRTTVSRFENGRRTMSVPDLLAAAVVLGCAVEELLASNAPVSAGGVSIEADELSTALSSPRTELEGWEAFEAATRHLTDARNASERYVGAMNRVRKRVPLSEGLREAIVQDQYDSAAQLAEWLDPDLNDWDESWDMTSQRALDNNISPALLAARDALAEHASYGHLLTSWKRRRRQPAGEDQGARS